MIIALAIAVPAYLLVASLIVLNSVLEAERPGLAPTDAAIIALVGAAWPVAGGVLLSALACRGLRRARRKIAPAARWRPFRSG